MKSKYKIVDSFCKRGYQVLVLDRNFDLRPASRVVVDGKKYPFILCSIRNWVTIHMDQIIKNKEVEFVD